MKLKFILSLLLLLAFMNANAHTLASNTKTSARVEISMYSNDIPFDILTTGEEDGSRSAFPLIPIVVFLEETNHSIVLDFIKPIGVVEVTISQNGAVVYSSLENIQDAMLNIIKLSPKLSGGFLLEIEGVNGACVYGDFCL